MAQEGDWYGYSSIPWWITLVDMFRYTYVHRFGHGYNGACISAWIEGLICTTMNVQNNPSIPSNILVNCNVLNTDTFESINEIPKNLNYIVYDLLGQVLYKGNTSNLELFWLHNLHKDTNPELTGC